MYLLLWIVILLIKAANDPVSIANQRSCDRHLSIMHCIWQQQDANKSWSVKKKLLPSQLYSEIAFRYSFAMPAYIFVSKSFTLKPPIFNEFPPVCWLPCKDLTKRFFFSLSRHFFSHACQCHRYQSGARFQKKSSSCDNKLFVYTNSDQSAIRSC